MWRIRWAPTNTSKWQIEFNFAFKVLIQTYKILHYIYRNLRTFVANYVIAVCFEDILVSALSIWRDNNAETCSNYVKDWAHKLQNIAFVGVARIIYRRVLCSVIGNENDHISGRRWAHPLLKLVFLFKEKKTIPVSVSKLDSQHITLSLKFGSQFH